MNKALENLKKLKDIYYEVQEATFGENLKLKLKLLSSEEETNVHSFAMSYEQGLAYLYSVKRETINYAIISLNNEDIPEFIEEGSEKIQRHVWLRKNITVGWNQMLIDQIWNHYAKLILKVEERILGTIKTEEKIEDKK